jgi:hypothetical protein
MESMSETFVTSLSSVEKNNNTRILDDAYVAEPNVLECSFSSCHSGDLFDVGLVVPNMAVEIFLTVCTEALAL